MASSDGGGVTSPRTQAARRTRIAELLGARSIHSQEELRAILADEGYLVTQATVSRDLLDLRAAKVPDASGLSVYVLPEGDDAAPAEAGHARSEMARLARTVHDMVVSVDHSGNIVVARTPPGGASYVASAIDRARWDAVLGTVAGDDTVLIVSRDALGGQALAAELMAMASGRAPATAGVPRGVAR